jgi:hypothetical protein
MARVVIPEPLLRVLEEEGVHYEVEARRKHNAVVVEGHIVAVVSMGSKTPASRTLQNGAARARRAIRAIREGRVP